jgi:hypothetical protein
VEFLCGGLGAEWISMTLRTITPNHRNLLQISLSVPDVSYGPTLNRIDPPNVRDAIGEVAHRQWLELDHRLVQLWESHSIRPKVMHYAPLGKDRKGPNSCVESFLPELTRRGIADLVKQATFTIDDRLLVNRGW